MGSLPGPAPHRPQRARLTHWVPHATDSLKRRQLSAQPEQKATDNCAVQTASIIPAVSHLSIMHRITPSLIRRSRISRKRWCAILRNISRCTHPSPNAGVHACSAIHCCFVNVFMSLCVLSIVSHQWLC